MWSSVIPHYVCLIKIFIFIIQTISILHMSTEILYSNVTACGMLCIYIYANIYFHLLWSFYDDLLQCYYCLALNLMELND